MYACVSAAFDTVHRLVLVYQQRHGAPSAVYQPARMAGGGHYASLCGRFTVSRTDRTQPKPAGIRRKH